jgi:hypothetical protein
MKSFLKLDWKAPFGAEMARCATLHHQFNKKQKYNKHLPDEYTSVPTESLSLPEAFASQAIAVAPAAISVLEIPQAFLIRMAATDALKPVLPAHVDYNRTCGINFYLEAGGETTHYYDWDQTSCTLQETASFQASQGDCWLIDTSIPHSVSLKPNQQRLILTLSFTKASFAQVSAFLREAGYV